MFSTKTVHVELSSKCTLKCPRCPRTEIKPEENNKEIKLDTFKSAFDLTMLEKIERFIFCGHLGDPIYARDFLDICRYVKDNSNTVIEIITNGSYKDEYWWQSLGQILTETDQVTFSVDGWDHDSNSLYRVNSDFKSIIVGVKTLVSTKRCRVNWSAIYFKYNENQFQQIKDLAKELGVDTFRSVKSSKFDWGYLDADQVDPLKPSTDFVSKTSAYEFETTIFKRPLLVLNEQSAQKHAWARCLNHTKEIFVSVAGLVFPCPWFDTGYHPNKFVKEHSDQLNIHNRSLTEILNDQLWIDFYKTLDTNPLDICKLKCKDTANDI